MDEAEKLTAFLLALQTSPRQRKRFDRDHRTEMERFNLSPGTIRAVLAGDSVELWRILRIPIRAQVGHVIQTRKRHRPRKTKRT
jgi:hypothetical protein